MANKRYGKNLTNVLYDKPPHMEDMANKRYGKNLINVSYDKPSHMILSNFFNAAKDKQYVHVIACWGLL